MSLFLTGVKRKGSLRFYIRSLSLVSCILFFSFLCFMLVFLVVYRQSADRLTATAVSESTRLLESTSREIATAYEREWLLLTDPEFISEVCQVFTRPADGSVIHSRLLSIQNMLADRFVSGDIFHDTALLVRTPDIDFLVSPLFISDDFRRDYSRGHFVMDNMTYDAFVQALVDSSVNRYTRTLDVSGRLSYSYDNKYAAKSCFYVYRYTQGNPSTELYALQQINLDALASALTTSNNIKYIEVQSLGKSLYSTWPQEESVDPALCIATTISNIGLEVRLALDEQAIHSNIDRFADLLRLLVIAFSALSVMMAFLLFLRWYYPVIHTSEQLSSGNGKTPLERIHSHIDQLASEKETATARLNHLRPAARSELLRCFYQGQPLAADDLAMLIPPAGSAEPDAYRCIVIGLLDAPEELCAYDAAILTAAKEHLPLLYAAGVLDDQFIALAPEPSKDQFLTSVRELLQSLNTHRPDERLFAIGISDTYLDFSGVPSAYREAQASWRNALIWQNPAVVFSGVQNELDERYRLSYERLDALQNALEAARNDDALRLFDQAVAETFGSLGGNRLKYLFCQQFYHDIMGILVRLSIRYDITPLPETLLSYADKKLPLAAQIQHLRSALEHCVELIANQRENSDLANQIQTYCIEQFSDPQMSLGVVASHFRLSESNMSKFFKSHTGVTFSNYIENLRIRQAEELMLRGGAAVHKAAIAVGYQNTTTFYNAFRRKHGCTPSQWAEQRKTQQ